MGIIKLLRKNIDNYFYKPVLKFLYETGVLDSMPIAKHLWVDAKEWDDSNKWTDEGN